MPAPTTKNIVEWLGRYFQGAWSLPRAAEVLAAKIKNAHSHKQVDEALDLANEMLNAHGVEAIRGAFHGDGYYQDIVALYVNMGCPYVPTVLYDTVKGKFVVTGWGDWVEAHEKKYRIE